jgi:glycosyltransferase involved in cell wall biosynthesis
MTSPQVTVICLCYNQANYLVEAVESVVSQTYPNIQLILVDDGSTDDSVAKIRILKEKYHFIELLILPKNTGYCKAFNSALKLTKGDFIIDLAGDDALFPDRIKKGIETFHLAGLEYGVQFSDAEIIADNGSHLYFHSERFPHHSIPQGDIYNHLIKRYFICSPSMMVRKKVLEDMNGYDEALAFEDFDLWIRSGRNCKYCYVPEVLVKKRIAKGSMSQDQFVRASLQRWSTLRVCEKIKSLNRREEENKALRHRLRYECMLSLKMMDVKLAFEFLKLWRRV